MTGARLIEGDDEWRMVLALRVAVFVDEQKGPADEEPDPFDPTALHLILREGDRAIGCARILGKGAGVVKIGRVAVRSERRGEGIGRLLMGEALRIAQVSGARDAILDAQVTAIGFYENLGFVAEGPVFFDGGLPHRRMRRPLSKRRGEDTEWT